MRGFGVLAAAIFVSTLACVLPPPRTPGEPAVDPVVRVPAPPLPPPPVVIVPAPGEAVPVVPQPVEPVVPVAPAPQKPVRPGPEPQKPPGLPRVGVEGDGVVELVGPGGPFRVPGTVPEGSYEISVSFDGAAAVRTGSVRVTAAGATIRCNAALGLCR